MFSAEVDHQRAPYSLGFRPGSAAQCGAARRLARVGPGEVGRPWAVLPRLEPFEAGHQSGWCCRAVVAAPAHDNTCRRLPRPYPWRATYTYLSPRASLGRSSHKEPVLLDGPAGRLAPRREPELVQDMADVRIDRARRQDQRSRDAAVGEPLGDQAGHLPLTRAECPACRWAGDRCDELLGFAHAQLAADRTRQRGLIQSSSGANVSELGRVAGAAWRVGVGGLAPLPALTWSERSALAMGRRARHGDMTPVG